MTHGDYGRLTKSRSLPVDKARSITLTVLYLGKLLVKNQARSLVAPYGTPEEEKFFHLSIMIK